MLSATTNPIRIAIADDHAIVCEGYRRLLELEDDMKLVGTFATGDAAYRWLTRHDADVLVLDISMPGRGGFDTLKRLHEERPHLRIVVFTMHDSESLADHAARLGAARFINKASSPQALIRAVREVAAARSPAASRISKQNADEEHAAYPHALLTTREFDIFLLLARGASVDAIASRCALSKKTIANYQAMIRHKTGCKSQLDIYRYALQYQLVPSDTLSYPHRDS